MVELHIREALQKRVEETVEYVLANVPACTVYLFGSFAKRKIKPTSDIDLLVLVDQPLSLKEIRDLRIQLNNDYEEKIHFEYEVDIKVYYKLHFEEKLQKPSFEREIYNYMIKVGDNHE